MSLRRRGGGDALNPWPGYVDALSTLLMVIIFVLLVFVLAQAFLGIALTGKDQALDRLNRQMSEMSDMLSLERNRTTELRGSVAALIRDLSATTQSRDELKILSGTQQAQIAAAQTARGALAAQLLQETARADAIGRTGTAAAIALTGTLGRLAEVQGELDRTVTADRATVQAQLADLAKLTDQIAALAALRDELQAQVRTAAAATLTEAQARAAVAAQLDDERSLSDSARAQIALMNRQVAELRAQLRQIAAALEVTGRASAEKDTQIENLSGKLNAALASKVEELQRYRSEFFGRLRDVLATRPGVQIVGDRFVFQSEVLFPPGSAEMTAAGQDQIRALAGTLKTLAGEIPRDIAWIMRVDGHADPTPVSRGAFASNWELSAQRAITVVKLLAAEGVPANHLAATGFGEFQPLAPGDTPEAYARDRRIELRLTDR